MFLPMPPPEVEQMKVWRLYLHFKDGQFCEGYKISAFSEEHAMEIARQLVHGRMYFIITFIADDAVRH